MQIEVAELRRERGSSEKFSGRIPHLEIELKGREVTFRDITVAGTATNTGESIYVKGGVRAVADSICSLCLEPFPLKLQFPLEETYYREGEAGQEETGERRTYQGEVINLDDPIREGLILAVPMKPLCRPDCKGLCPVCGGNRNIRSCSCTTQAVDPRLAVLKEFFKETNKH